MLPKLRIILAAVFATCAVVLALSAGMLGARPPGDDLSGVPEISRTLVRQAIVAEPDRQQFQLLAYSRRADELLRLRDLPVTPARAVVDYAEQAQARAAETASAPARPAATLPTESVTAAAAAASETGPTADAPTDALPPATIAMAPVANPHGDTTAATPVQPASPPPVTAPAPADTATAPAPDDAPAETAAASTPAPAVSGDTRVAAVHPGGGVTAGMYGPEKPKSESKPHHRAKVARPHPSKPKKKTQVAVGNTRPAPAPSTAFPVNQPNNRNNAFGGWRYDSTAR